MCYRENSGALNEPARSSLEALRNYEASLKAKGFTTLFTCNAADGSCFVKKSPEAAYYVG